ncbi:MAG TPA: BTAD domain-containing putative transcriptional regulator [Candidatus Limnocylindrales bacterium]|nr:BTAD domain-containing putative transcriptional regulator [Candidatus Limnocylindrales bacterium]
MQTEIQTEIKVLGPVAVRGPHGFALLSGTRQKCLVALLALSNGRPLGRERLVDAMWGEDPPRTAIKTLHSHVARVRQALADCGLPGLLVTQGQSYVFTAPREVIDAFRFEDHVLAARRHLGAGEQAAAITRLRSALELWLDEALADAAPAGWAEAEVARLHEAKLNATEDLWEAELASGHYAAAVGELSRLVAAYPLRERLVGLNMLALYRCGRHAEALDAYQRLRTHLADELGVDPSPELQRRFTAMLRHDPSLGVAGASSVPAQLPATVGHFTGRTEALSKLDALGQPGSEHRFAVISGQAGIGKTALAVAWAHRVASRFTAGQLVIDLRGHDPDSALSPAQALGHLLQGLGVSANRIPVQLEDLVTLYRSLTSGKPILVVLDNAGSVDQVLPLVPSTDTGFLLITSRQRLSALAAYHAMTFIPLDALATADAKTLLGRVAGADRVEREPRAVAAIAELCGGLPLALRIAAARLVAEPDRSIGQLADDLTAGNTLDELSVPGDTRSVRTVFSGAYRALPPETAKLFRRLGWHPGSTFDAHVAAAIAGLDPAQARAGLASLAAEHLIVPSGDRYRFHDLLRLYAAECTRRDEPETAHEQIVARLLDWYLAMAHAANQVIGPARNRVTPTPVHVPAQLPFGGKHDEILSYLDGEHGNMMPIVRYAAEHGHDVAAWQLTYLLTGFFEYRGYWAERLELCRLGLAAAERLGDGFAAGLMLSTLGVACVELHRFHDALEHLRLAFERMESVGDKRGQGVALNNMAVACIGLRRYAGAVDAAGQALVLHRAQNHTVGTALALNNLGYSYAELGRFDVALPHLAEALTISRRLRNPRLEAGVLNTLGEVHLDAGDPQAALDSLTEALSARRAIGDRRNEAETLNLLGLTHLKLGDPGAALDCLSEAVVISGDVGDQHLEALVRANMGASYLSTSDLASAENQLLRALELRTRVPDSVEEVTIHIGLAEVADRRGDTDTGRWHRDLAESRRHHTSTVSTPGR